MAVPGPPTGRNVFSGLIQTARIASRRVPQGCPWVAPGALDPPVTGFGGPARAPGLPSRGAWGPEKVFLRRLLEGSDPVAVAGRCEPEEGAARLLDGANPEAVNTIEVRD